MAPPRTQEPSPLKCLSAETGIRTQTLGEMGRDVGNLAQKAQNCTIWRRFPFNAFLKRLNLLTRKQASTILQIRCGHFPLNAYLHKINKADSSRCPARDEDQEGLSLPEAINHFVFDCTVHLVAREELTGKIGMINFNLSDIMADADRMKALTTFINRTQRFRA